MSSEMGLDSVDPLNLLLQNGDSSSDEASSAQDWSKFSTLWADGAEAGKPYSDMMDFADLGSLPMDMDFNPSIEPSALHYDPMKYGFSYDDQFNALSSELLATQFPFAFPAGLSAGDFSGSSSDSSQSFTKERRLSITSSSSSSGASLSPVPESVQSPAPSDIQPKEEPPLDPAAALAQRVRQSAGVMLAVPMNAQLQGTGIHIPATNASKLPIPRLPQHQPMSTPKPSDASTSSSAASTPPPSTPPVNTFKLASTAPAPAEAPPSTAGMPRPKTSHTTIERRYRTNLNARIQSLRMAVPALRVLEDREGGNGKKIKKNVKGSVLIKGAGMPNVDSDDVDVIDERGFVDGVKVARKCSKANVLGKAVEYIRVLKKREHRLKAEQAGLKTLISGLVGGPALVREWEREWRASFGGEEKDEVEGDDEDADDDDSEDDDGEDGDEDGGRKRKRPKASGVPAVKKPSAEKKKPTLSPSEVGSSATPEKRKRGRPRKVLPPPASLGPVATSPSEGSVHDESLTPSTPYTATPPQWAQQQAQPQQYLLAVFALFSFFNSPLTSTTSFHPQHHHTGAVLSAAQAPSADGWAWKEYMQVLHLVVSVLVLASFVGHWLGINFTLGFGKIVARQRSMSVVAAAANRNRKARFVSWPALARDCALEGSASSMSSYERVQVYRSISTKRNNSMSDLANLSIVLHGTTGLFAGLAAMKARSVWATAKTQSEKASPNNPTKVSEQIVLETLTVENAAGYLAKATLTDLSDGERAYTPIEVLGCLVVKERVKAHLASLFVQSVADEAEAQTQDQEWRRTIDAARELGGHVEQLGKTLERAWKADPAAIEDDDLALGVDAGDEGSASADTDIRALLTAVVLYRRLFAEAHDGALSSSTLLSPPPTPTAKTTIKRGQMLQALRTVLGIRVFEDEGIVGARAARDVDADEDAVEELGLEDARDRVVDMIFDSERRLRAASPS